jgi:hypothetical protein
VVFLENLCGWRALYCGRGAASPEDGGVVDSRNFQMTRIPSRDLSRGVVGVALVGLWVVGGVGAEEAGEIAAEDLEFFEKKVRPLLVENCYQCHSAEEKIRGGLRLDHRDGWLHGGDSGPAVEPGDSGASLLVRAVRREGGGLEMPPDEKLSEAEVAILEEWVERGAPDPRLGGGIAVSALPGGDLWSLAPPRAPEVPEVAGEGWARGEIDRFLLARMEETGVEPSPQAAPGVLLRRLSYALTGLPPSERDLAAFEADPSDGHYEDMVERYLGSVAFGERWARHWMDIVRFAESSGGGRTLPFRDAWRFRDYLIEAFREDRPLDLMVREHVAGDLLAAEVDDIEEKRRRMIASTYLAIGPTNYEEQDKQQLRWDVIDEQLDSIGKGFLGISISCARCHDHKFDPFTARDYYGMAGIFASVRTLYNLTDNVARWVDLELPMSGEAAAELERKERELAQLRAELAGLRAMAKGSEAGLRGVIDPASLPGVVVDDVDAVLVGEWTRSTYGNAFVGEHALHDGAEGKGAKTVSFPVLVPEDGDYEVRLSYVSGSNRSVNTPVKILYDGGEVEVEVDQRKAPPVLGRFVSLGVHPFRMDGGGMVVVGTAGTAGHVSVDAVQLLKVGEDGDEVVAGVGDGVEKGEDLAGRIKALEVRIKERAAQGPTAERAMSVAEDKVQDVPVAIRGDYRREGAVVARGFPVAFTPFDDVALPGAASSGRAELGEWLTHRENPLTSRVLANRVWHWLFGRGIVSTVDNFGSTGAAPTHPELLDHLAVGLVEGGWSLKALVRDIVLSAAWRQDSAARLELGAVDPDNELLARMPVKRMEVEAMRDTMLLLSGELDERVGGSFLVDAGEADPNSTATQNFEYGWKYEDTRRSLYAAGFRTNRSEFFMAFDGADPNVVMGARHRSTTSNQALFLMNHPYVLARVDAAAELLVAGEVEGSLDGLWRRALSRVPEGGEREALLEHLRAGEQGGEAGLKEAWAEVVQVLFSSIDFRHVH